jgi:abortive infection bacteriophage resistance protein
MTKQPFTKPPLSVLEQIELLKSRGMVIPDEARAEHYLNTISYYRLSGYMYPFLADKKLHLYKKDVTFDDILNLYRFDRELRQLIFTTIEKIEIALRTQIINHFSKYFNDPFWYTNTTYFTDMKKHTDLLKGIFDNINRSRSNDVFIKHFYNSYNDPYPPVWITFETLSMGQLSILYSNTAKSPPRKTTADFFGVKELILISWLHSLVYVRNICAHHARLWNKDLRITVKLPKKTAHTWLSVGNLTDRKIYVVLGIIIYMLDTISPHHTFRQKIKGLITKYPNTDIAAMGFPKDWLSDPFWLI